MYRQPYFYGATESELRLHSRSLIYVALQLRLLQLMPATADDRYVDANIFASARNTVRVRRGSVSSLTIGGVECPQLNAR